MYVMVWFTYLLDYLLWWYWDHASIWISVGPVRFRDGCFGDAPQRFLNIGVNTGGAASHRCYGGATEVLPSGIVTRTFYFSSPWGTGYESHLTNDFQKICEVHIIPLIEAKRLIYMHNYDLNVCLLLFYVREQPIKLNEKMMKIIWIFLFVQCEFKETEIILILKVANVYVLMEYTNMFYEICDMQFLVIFIFH